jgi:hypothetical protein
MESHVDLPYETPESSRALTYADFFLNVDFLESFAP